MSTDTAVATIPVARIVGPTIQGDGPAAGRRAYVVRCMDSTSPNEVLPRQSLTVDEIAERLTELGAAKPVGVHNLIVFSGGNPALRHMDTLFNVIGRWPVEFHVETKGTLFRSWMNRCDMVVVSPLPPSAWDVHQDKHAMEGVIAARAFCARLSVPWVLKFTVFDEVDLDFAVEARRQILAAAPLGYYEGAFLSSGMVPGLSRQDTEADIIRRFRWLASEHCTKRSLADFRVGLPIDVLAGL